MKTGDLVWFAPHDKRFNGEPRFVPITKVGKKYAHISDWERFTIADINTGRSQFWTSEAKWADAAERTAAWSALRDRVARNWTYPDFLTTAEVRAIDAMILAKSRVEVVAALRKAAELAESEGM